MALLVGEEMVPSPKQFQFPPPAELPPQGVLSPNGPCSMPSLLRQLTEAVAVRWLLPVVTVIHKSAPITNYNIGRKVYHQSEGVLSGLFGLWESGGDSQAKRNAALAVTMVNKSGVGGVQLGHGE